VTIEAISKIGVRDGGKVGVIDGGGVRVVLWAIQVGVDVEVVVGMTVEVSGTDMPVGEVQAARIRRERSAKPHFFFIDVCSFG
jgi:hypothetical protein